MEIPVLDPLPHFDVLETRELRDDRSQGRLARAGRSRDQDVRALLHHRIGLGLKR